MDLQCSDPRRLIADKFGYSQEEARGVLEQWVHARDKGLAFEVMT